MPENEYISVTQFAQKFGKDVGNVRKLIKDGRIPAIKIGNQWAIPADAEPPADKRVKSGEYRNWRKKKDSSEKLMRSFSFFLHDTTITQKYVPFVTLFSSREDKRIFFLPRKIFCVRQVYLSTPKAHRPLRC